MATPNSEHLDASPKRAERVAVRKFTRHQLALAGSLSVTLLTLCSIGFSEGKEGKETTATRVEKAYIQARTRYQSDTNSTDNAWQLGRACFDWAEIAATSEWRAEVAQQGIAVCRGLIAREPGLAAGQYYLGMNLAQLARTKSLGALRIVSEMEKVFKRVLELDAKFDNAGADRNLGLLYLQAPVWPTSIGSRPKARQHLEHAVELAPDYPENALNLIEAYLKWDEPKNATRAAKALEALLPAARDKFSGETWESSWTDWNKRWQKIKDKLGRALREKK